MTPVHCLIPHNPEAGTYGDCLRACIASVMDLPAEHVPHFAHDGCNGDGAVLIGRLRDWLKGHGYVTFFAHFDGWAPYSDVLEMMGEDNPDTHYLLFGKSGEGDHVVVCRGGRMVHNPAWLPGTLKGPSSNGVWSVMVVARA